MLLAKDDASSEATMKRELVAAPMKVSFANKGSGELLVQEILPSPHLVYFSFSLTFSGAPRGKGAGVI